MGPERVRKNNRKVQDELRLMLLSELRKAEAVLQAELARRLGVSQPAITRIEAQDDVQLSTSHRLIEALGGSLEVIAKLRGGTYCLGQFTAS